MTPPYPPNRLYATRVSAIARLSPHFTRVTVQSPDVSHVPVTGLDLRIKLLFAPSAGLPDIGLHERDVADWYPDWRALPTAARGAMRTYTVRAVRPELGELDIDFVLHGVQGPASAWATHASVGDELLIIAPDARSGVAPAGFDWKPGSAARVLLAADETAVPAIAAILESLGPDLTGEVFIEVPEPGDALELVAASELRVTWLSRGAGPHGARLAEAVRAWGAEQGATGAPAPQYVWLAGESGIVTGLRRFFVRELGLDRRQVTFVGYWKQGAAEVN